MASWMDGDGLAGHPGLGPYLGVDMIAQMVYFDGYEHSPSNRNHQMDRPNHQSDSPEHLRIPMTFHRYGSFDQEHRRGGRYGDLSGQDYWTEVDGVRWEIESSRQPWTPTMWTAWTGDPADDSYVFLIAWSRQDLKEQIALETVRRDNG